jgi:hypothetical protein
VEHGKARRGDFASITDASVQDDSADVTLQRAADDHVATMSSFECVLNVQNNDFASLCTSNCLVQR